MLAQSHRPGFVSKRLLMWLCALLLLSTGAAVANIHVMHHLWRQTEARRATADENATQAFAGLQKTFADGLSEHLRNEQVHSREQRASLKALAKEFEAFAQRNTA